MEILKKVLQNKRFCITLAIILLSIKLITYYILIDGEIGDFYNLIITFSLFFCLFFGLVLSKLKYKRIIFLILYAGFAILMFADSMYYNYYHQTVSIKQLWQIKNVASVPDSLVATLIPSTIFFIIDIPFIYYLFRKYENSDYTIKSLLTKKISSNIKGMNYLIGVLLLVVVINPLNSVMLTRINSLEFFASHFRDVYLALTENLISEKISAEEILEVVEEINEDEPSSGYLRYHGIGANRNVILVQVEALQNFVIGRDYQGVELTPNLNQLIKENSLYFDQYYSHIGKGNTSDAEFSTLNSLYPVIDREIYTLYKDNTFYGLPWILKEEGYETLAFHGYEGEFWNRKEAYPGQGIDEFYSMEDLDQSDSIGMGISDLSVFNQAVEIMKEKEAPFFSFIVTLTNHHPYILPEELHTVDLLEEHKDTKFGNYLNTVRYTDYAIGEFIRKLKSEGLYDNSVIIFYGDHHGLNYGMDDNDIIVSDYLGKTYDYDEMLKVPLIIHIPGSGIRETISTTGGFIDFLPTIANIMNLEIPHPYTLGQDIINESDGIVAFTSYLLEGSFIKNNIILEISREGILEGSRAWNIHTYESIDPLLLEEDYELALTLKKTSEEILEQDLIKDYISNIKNR